MKTKVFAVASLIFSLVALMPLSAHGSTNRTWEFGEAWLDQIATPANPASGKVKFYSKSGDILAWLNSAGTEKTVNKGTDIDSTGGAANACLLSDGSGGSSWSLLSDASIAAAAGIQRSKIATGTVGQVVINDPATGALSSEAQLAISRGGTGAGTASAAFDALSPTTTKGDLIANDGTHNVRFPVCGDGDIISADSSQSSGWKCTSPGVSPATTSNGLLNSNFRFWQAGTSQTISNGSSTYGPDQWYVKNSLGTNGVITLSRVTGAVGGDLYGAQVKITTAPTVSQSNGTELYQVLENQDSMKFYNQTSSFGIEVKSLGNVNQVGLEFVYATSETKPSTTVGVESLCTVNSASFTQCNLTAQALGTAMTTAGVIGVRVRITGVSTGNPYDLNNGFTVEQGMLNTGSAVSSWLLASGSEGAELSALQRFYEKSYASDTAPGTASDSAGMANVYSMGSGGAGTTFEFISFKATKRTSPTVIDYSPNSGASGNVYITGPAGDSVTGCISFIGTDGFTFGTTSNIVNAGNAVEAQWTADARI